MRPAARAELKPGGMHVMFMSINRQLKAGETVRATLVFEKAGKVDVVFRSCRSAAKRRMRTAPTRARARPAPVRRPRRGAG